MTNKGRFQGQIGVERGFKRKETQQFVRTAGYFSSPAATPGVDRGTHIVNGGHTPPPEGSLKQKIENVEVHAYKDIQLPC